MGCVDGKFAKISREVKDQLGNTYYDPDSFKPHLNYGKGYGTFFNLNDDLSFNSFVIYSKDDNFLEREINNFIKNIKKIDVQEILGKGYHLDEHWLHIGNKKPHKYKKGIFTVTITLKEDPNYKITYNNKSKENAKVIIAKNYDPAYDTETEIPLTSYEQEAKEITGWTDALVREYSNLGILEEQVRKYIDGKRLRKTSKVTKEDIKFQKAQKEFDKNPKVKTVQIEDTKFKKGKNGIVSDGQLSLELDSPVIEDTLPSKHNKVLEAIEKEMQDIKAKAVADGRIVLKADGTFDYALAPNGKKSNLNERQWLQVRTKSFKDWFGDWINDPANASKVVDENGEPLVVYHGSNNIFDTFDKTKQGIHTGANSSKLGFFFASNENAAAYYVDEINSPISAINIDDYLKNNNTLVAYSKFLGVSINEAFEKINEVNDFTNNQENNYQLFILSETLQDIIEENEKIKNINKEIEKTLDEHIIGVFLNIRNGNVSNNHNRNLIVDSFTDFIEISKNSGKDGVIFTNTKDPIDTDVYVVFEPNQIKSATDNAGTFSKEDNNIYHAPDLDNEYFDSEEGIGEEELGVDDLDFSLENLNQNQDTLIEDDLNQEIDENIGRFDEEDEAIREALLSVPNDPFQEIIDNNDTLSDRVNGQVLSELIDQMIWEKKKLLKNYDNHLKALEKLKRKINNSKYLEQKRKYRHLSDKLEEEIKELEEENKKRDAETVLNSIKREIVALQEYLNKDVIDFDDIKIDLLEKRINTLYKYLFGKDIYGNDSDLPLRIIDSSDIELITIKNDLDNIKQEFEKKQEDFVINYAEKDLESRVDDTEKREAIIELFKAIVQNPDLYIEKDQKWMKWLKYVADAEQGLTIFGAVIKSYLEDQKDKFAIGLNRSFLQIKTLENKLKKEDKNYNSTIFLKKDDHGNNTNRLITKYNDNWNVFYRGLYSFRRKYEWQLAKGKYKKYKKQAFENYRNYLLDNADIFQLGEYDEIWEAIKEYDVDNGTNFYDRLKQYKSSTQTHYQEYEKFPSRKHFENDVIQKQIELLTRYLDKIKNEEEDNDVELDLNRDFRNPFVFARDFKTTKYFYEQPASSNYIVLIPKKESYYDKNYNKISSNHDYEEIWALLEDFLMNQLNPLLIENNADIAIDEIPFEISLYNSQYAKNLGWLKRLGLNIYDKSSLTFRQPFYSKNYIHGSVTNKVPVPQSSGSMSINRIKTLYKYADIKTLQDLLNSQKISHYTFEQFLDKNLSQEQRNPYNLKKINSLYRYYLLDLLANASILPHVNQDIVANIGAILDGVSDMAARVETQPFADIVLNILSGKNENHIGSFDNLIRVLRIWVQQNIYANSIADSASGWNIPGNKVYRNPKEDIEHDTLKNITESTDSVLRAFDFGNNHYRLNIILKDSHGKIIDPEEQENILYTSDFFGKLKNHEIHNLTINGKTYSIDVSFLRNGAIITRDQYLDAQRDTFTQSLQDIGTRRTWGNELRGLQSMKVGKDLSINPESGFRNRQEGMYTNIRLAVQGMFSFGEEELYAAKRFLLGIIASRLNGLSYIEYKIAPERYAQLKVYELFTQQLMIFQDHTNLGLSESEKYNLTKFSIEFPETWNQGEVILATLISKDIKIQNNKGEWVPIWDKENNCFNIYDTEVAVQTGKLQLKPEFRTEENVEHWEDFSSEDGYNVNKQLLKECKRNVTRSQGNYENLDKVAATASVAGRTGYTYKRYMYSHLKQRYNHQDIDYLAGDLDVRGMMDVLVEHPQAFFIFMLLNTLMTLKTGPVNVIRAKLDGKRMWLEILRVFFHTSVPLPFAIHMWRKGNHVAKWWSVEESKIALSLLMEVATRTMSTSINQLTYGKFINKVGKINNFTKNKWARGNYMTEKDRRIMSGSAQQVAGNIHLAIILFGMNIAYKAILESLRDCDTEEECLRKAKRMKYYQKLMFFAINAVHQLCIDTARWVDPTLLWNDVSNVSLVEFCKKWFKILTKLQNDDLEVNEKLSYTLKSLPQPFIPNQIANPIMTIGSNALTGKDLLENMEIPMQDSHVYESYAYDYLLQTNAQERENWYKAFKKETKKYARKYKNRLRKSDNDYSESEIESMVKEFNKTYGKPNGYTKADFLENASKSDYKEWTKDLREASKDVD